MEKFINDVCNESRAKIVDRLSTGIAWAVLTGIPAIAALFPVPSLIALVSGLTGRLVWKVVYRNRKLKRFMVLAGTHTERSVRGRRGRTYKAGEIVECEHDLMARFVNKFARV